MRRGSPRIRDEARRGVLGRPKWAVSAAAATLMIALGGLGVGLSGFGGTGIANAAPPSGPPSTAPFTAPCSAPVTTAKTDLVTKPGTCHGTATLQAQVDFLTKTVNYYRKTSAKFTSNGPGPGQALDYGLETLWLRGIDGNGVTVAVMEEWNNPTVASTLKSESTRYHLPWTTSWVRTIFTEEPTHFDPNGTVTNGALPTVKAKPATTPKVTGGPHVTVTLRTGKPGVRTTTCPHGMVILGSYGSCSAWQGELNLDVQVVHLFAPYAKIVVSASPADSQITDDPAYNVAAPELIHAVAYIAEHNIAQTISISDGTSETTYSYGWATLTAQNVAEAQAAADGVPVMVATGDCGVVQNLAAASSQCGNASSTPQTAAWDDSPWITAVGGSRPHITKETVTGVEKGVKSENDTLTHIEGAGLSALYPKPAYQDSVNSSTQRSVPTVVMDSAFGTSQAAPSFNGVIALATQLYNVGNKGAEKPIGPIQTALYKIGPEGAAAGILNVVTGNDTSAASARTTYKTPSFPVGPRIATPGWVTGAGFNVASGWGDVTANKFVYALDKETMILKTEASARAAAASQVASLEKLQTYTTPNSDATYVLGKTLIPYHPVTLYITTVRVWPLSPTAGTWLYKTTHTALTVAERQYIVDAQGYVTFMITPLKVPKPTAKFTKKVKVHTARTGTTTTEPTLSNPTTFYALSPGAHTVRLSSLLMTQTATFTVAG